MLRTRPKTRETSELNIQIDNNTLKQVNKQKILGVFIDENLTWTAQIDYYMYIL